MPSSAKPVGNDSMRDINPLAAVAVVCLLYILKAFGGIGLEREIGKNLVFDVFLLLCAIALARRARIQFFRPAEPGTRGLQPLDSARLVSLVLLGLLLTHTALLFYGAGARLTLSEACQRASLGSLDLIRTVLVSPISEELIYTGFLFAVFRARFGARLGILVTALLFSLLHLPDNFDHFVSRLLYLSGSCVLLLRCQVIWPSIVLHALNNLALLLLDQAVSWCEYLLRMKGAWQGSGYVIATMFALFLWHLGRGELRSKPPPGE